jgi:hypothetical protein
MKKPEIMNKLSRSFYRTGLKLKKHSPEILVITGVVGTVASAVMACKATTKLDSVLAENQKNISKIKDYVVEEGFSEQYTESDYKKDLTITYVQSGAKVAKLYAPAVAVGALSITAILTGHNIMRKRYFAMTAAYTAVDSAFKEYRGRVVDRFGKELDRELRYNIKSEEVEEVVQNEDGSETVVKKTTNTVELLESDYAKLWDCGSTGWTKDPEYNLMFLRNQQRYANDILRSKGHLFLNEVYDMLGIPRTKAGNIVGWIYDEKNPNGDNYVDFNIFDKNSPANARFVNGDERSVLLDFNVDGPILDLI